MGLVNDYLVLQCYYTVRGLFFISVSNDNGRNESEIGNRYTQQYNNKNQGLRLIFSPFSFIWLDLLS